VKPTAMCESIWTYKFIFMVSSCSLNFIAISLTLIGACSFPMLNVASLIRLRAMCRIRLSTMISLQRTVDGGRRRTKVQASCPLVALFLATGSIQEASQ
jgi:hypothetical protein